MQEGKKKSVPPTLIVLDMIGTVFIGLGLAKYFANVDAIPVQLRFANYELVFIGAGAALAAPLFVHFVKKLAGAAQTKRP